MSAAWDINELVLWGLKHREQAESLGHQFIFVQQIYPGAARISSQSVEFEGIAQYMAQEALRGRRAFVLLKNTLPPCGWFLADYGNVAGDRSDVNRLLGEIYRAAAERHPDAPAMTSP